jgi:hypothetical protein
VFPHPLVPSLLHGACTHPIEPLGIHLLECAHDNEHTWTHDAMRDVVALIAWEVSFQVVCEQLHMFLSFAQPTFHWCVNIMNKHIQKQGRHLNKHSDCKSYMHWPYTLNHFNILIPNFIGAPNKGKQLQRLTLRKPIHAINIESFCLFTQACSWLLKSLCQQYMRNERLRKLATFNCNNCI